MARAPRRPLPSGARPSRGARRRPRGRGAGSSAAEREAALRRSRPPRERRDAAAGRSVSKSRARIAAGRRSSEAADEERRKTPTAREARRRGASGAPTTAERAGRAQGERQARPEAAPTLPCQQQLRRRRQHDRPPPSQAASRQRSPAVAGQGLRHSAAAAPRARRPRRSARHGRSRSRRAARSRDRAGQRMTREWIGKNSRPGQRSGERRPAPPELERQEEVDGHEAPVEESDGRKTHRAGRECARLHDHHPPMTAAVSTARQTAAIPSPATSACSSVRRLAEAPQQPVGEVASQADGGDPADELLQRHAGDRDERRYETVGNARRGAPRSAADRDRPHPSVGRRRQQEDRHRSGRRGSPGGARARSRSTARRAPRSRAAAEPSSRHGSTQPSGRRICEPRLGDEAGLDGLDSGLFLLRHDLRPSAASRAGSNGRVPTSRRRTKATPRPSSSQSPGPQRPRSVEVDRRRDALRRSRFRIALRRRIEVLPRASRSTAVGIPADAGVRPRRAPRAGRSKAAPSRSSRRPLPPRIDVRDALARLRERRARRAGVAQEEGALRVARGGTVRSLRPWARSAMLGDRGRPVGVSIASSSHSPHSRFELRREPLSPAPSREETVLDQFAQQRARSGRLAPPPTEVARSSAARTSPPSQRATQRSARPRWTTVGGSAPKRTRPRPRPALAGAEREQRSRAPRSSSSCLTARRIASTSIGLPDRMPSRRKRCRPSFAVNDRARDRPSLQSEDRRPPPPAAGPCAGSTRSGRRRGRHRIRVALGEGVSKPVPLLQLGRGSPAILALGLRARRGIGLRGAAGRCG